MTKILVVARTEFGNAVRSRAFVASLLLVPFLYGLMILMQVFANRADVSPRAFAVVDRTGMLFPAIAQAAEGRNKTILGPDGKFKESPYYPREIKDDGKGAEEMALSLSEKVRSKELYAFVEIPAEAIKAEAGGPVTLRYSSETPNANDLRFWIDAVVAGNSRSIRYTAAGLDPMLAAKIDRPIFSENLGLASRSRAAASGPGTPSNPATPPGGAIVAAQKIDPVRSAFLPLGLAMVIYIVTMTQAPQLVSSVMEEKMSRISEMLLGSVTPFELMMGKLIGNVATASLTTCLYLVAGYAAAARYGYADALTPGLLGTLALFVVLAILLFGSLYMAAGFGVQRHEGGADPDLADHGPGDRPDGDGRPRADQPVEHRLDGRLAHPVRRADPHDHADGPEPRPSDLAGGLVDRADRRDRPGLRVGLRADLPRGNPHARQGPEPPRADQVDRREVTHSPWSLVISPWSLVPGHCPDR